MAVKHTVAHNCPHSEISTDRDKSRKTHGARDRREIAVRGGGGGGGKVGVCSAVVSEGELFGVKICLNGCWGSIYYRQEAEGGFSSHLM